MQGTKGNNYPPAWAGPVPAHFKWLGRVQPKKRKKEKGKEKEKLRSVGPLVGPTHIFYNIFNYDNIIIYYNIIYLRNKKIPKGNFKIILIFSRVILSILFNIGLYFYTVRYRSGIKILSFLQKFSKKNLKTFKLISPFKKQKQNIFFFMHTTKS
jgi:hypothetical protein